MNAFVFCLGAAYVATAVLEWREPPNHLGIFALIERGKEALMFLIGLLYIEHSGLVALMMASSAVASH